MRWKTINLAELVENFSVRAKDHSSDTSALEFCGVSNEDGITKSKYAAEDKAEDYKIIEKDCFAYNPYRINVGSIGLIENEIVGLISPAYVVFKPKPRSILPQLLLKFLKSTEGLRQIKMYARGTVRQALRFEDLCKIEITIPEYDEQNEVLKRILDTEIEKKALSSELTHQLSLVKQLRQAFLREAMQGKLVAQAPQDEPAAQLLAKIKAEKKSKRDKD
ncbi:MAG TPA: restriction endonuclease subunit S, partial [Haliscomenobacter sp.]|nr:restriction endonuclease subunit S [Haliscomenobacter sp.]